MRAALRNDAKTMPKVWLDRVSKSYGEVPALREMSLDVMQGEFLTLLGPSGSGKSTLLGILAGLITPDRGDVWIGGRLATHLRPERRDIGMVFQHYALFPHMSVAENIAFPLRMRDEDPATIRRKVADILDVVRLPHLADRSMHEMSGGQAQRIALARAAVYDPSLILMDEPLGALDKKLRDHMRFEIRRIQREIGATIIYVTHDQEEALSMSDRICLMSEGGVEQIGSPSALYFDPVSLFAADFLGESNLFAARVSQRSGESLTLAGPAGHVFEHCNCRSSNFQMDEDVLCLVRPEVVRPCERNDAAGHEAEMTVSDIVLTGMTQHVYGVLGDGTPIRWSLLTSRRTAPPARGERLRVGWHPDDLVVLKKPDL